MPDAPVFDISQPLTNAVTLDSSRIGKIQFTVNNVSGRPLPRVDARLIPLPNESNKGTDYGKWLKLAEEGYRKFDIGQALTYSTLINVPASGEPGGYAFRLDVCEVGHEDDTLVSSPSVAFIVPAKPIPPPPLWWKWAAAGAAVVVLVAVAFVAARLIFGNSQPATAPTTTPAGTASFADFSGNWYLVKANATQTITLHLTQTGFTVSGAGTVKSSARVIVGSSTTASILGNLHGLNLDGELSECTTSIVAGGTKCSPSVPFHWTMTDLQNQEFHGSLGTDAGWCGRRVGATNPCN